MEDCRQTSVRLIPGIADSGDSKIDNLDVVIVQQHHIRGFYVAMDDAALVSIN